MEREATTSQEAPQPSRRSFLVGSSRLAMLAGLAAGYGALARIAARYLYPATEEPKQWLFVTELAAVPLGGSLRYVAPTGEPVAITRQGEAGVAADFVALSSTCPHLGCQVHWQAAEKRFFCPCHNGAFDPSGKAVSGPPADAGQALAAYPLKVEGGLLFIEVPVERVVQGSPGDRRGHGSHASRTVHETPADRTTRRRA